MFPRALSLTAVRGFDRGAARPRRPSNRTRVRPRLEGLEDRCLLSGISAINQTNLPVFQGGGTLYGGITTGPDGNIWFTVAAASTTGIGMINPTTHAVSEFSLSTANAWAYGIVAAPDGNLWFTEANANKIGMINPTTDAINEFALPKLKGKSNNSASPTGITVGPDGNLWFTESAGDNIGEINPTTHAISLFALPTANADPVGITAGPDGDLWFTEHSLSGAGKIGEINPTTHAISEFSTSTPVSAPFGIATGPDGNIWFTDAAANKVGMINPLTHVITEFATPQNDPQWITAGPDGNIWFTELWSSVEEIASINPTTDAITNDPVPDSTTTTGGITAGPDGNLWLTDGTENHNDGSVDYEIGVATLAASNLVVTRPPPSTIAAGSPFGLTVEAENSSGNPITSFNGTVTVALGDYPDAPTIPTLGGTLTATASNGVATFSGLTLTEAASIYTLYVSGGGYSWGVTGTFSVTPAAPAQLVITQQPPSTVQANAAFGFQATIEDQYGNVVTTATNAVSVAFASDPTGAALGGTLTVASSGGVATFSGLTISKKGSGYTLQVTGSGLTSATTNAITVTKASAAVPAAAGPAPVYLAPSVLDSPDFFDTLGIQKRARTGRAFQPEVRSDRAESGWKA